MRRFLLLAASCVLAIGCGGGEEPALHLRDAELRLLGRDDEVAREDDLEAAREGGSVDGRDDRDRAIAECAVAIENDVAAFADLQRFELRRRRAARCRRAPSADHSGPAARQISPRATIARATLMKPAMLAPFT